MLCQCFLENNPIDVIHLIKGSLENCIYNERKKYDNLLVTENIKITCIECLLYLLISVNTIILTIGKSS